MAAFHRREADATAQVEHRLVGSDHVVSQLADIHTAIRCAVNDCRGQWRHEGVDPAAKPDVAKRVDPRIVPVRNRRRCARRGRGILRPRRHSQVRRVHSTLGPRRTHVGWWLGGEARGDPGVHHEERYDRACRARVHFARSWVWRG